MRAIFIILIVVNLSFFGYQLLLAADKGSSGFSKASPASPTDTLKLVTEQGAALPQKAKTDFSARDTVTNRVGSDVEFCTIIGPYGQLLQAEYAVERLTALNVPARVTPIEIKEGESYWVYLKPEMSEKEAVRRLYELQSKNIESYVITKGELANGISLGRFADFGDAEVRVADVRNQGYAAEIIKLPKTIQETWVAIDADFAEKIDENVWVELLSKENGLEKRQNFCLGVASQ